MNIIDGVYKLPPKDLMKTNIKHNKKSKQKQKIREKTLM